MILQHIETKKQMNIGDKLTVTADCVQKGLVIEVQNIHPPNSYFSEGRIIYGIDKMYFKQLLPSLFGYEWVEDDSQAGV